MAAAGWRRHPARLRASETCVVSVVVSAHTAQAHASAQAHWQLDGTQTWRGVGSAGHAAAPLLAARDSCAPAVGGRTPAAERPAGGAGARLWRVHGVHGVDGMHHFACAVEQLSTQHKRNGRSTSDVAAPVLSTMCCHTLCASHRPITHTTISPNRQSHSHSQQTSPTPTPPYDSSATREMQVAQQQQQQWCSGLLHGSRPTSNGLLPGRAQPRLLPSAPRSSGAPGRQPTVVCAAAKQTQPQQQQQTKQKQPQKVEYGSSWYEQTRARPARTVREEIGEGGKALGVRGGTQQVQPEQLPHRERRQRLPHTPSPSLVTPHAHTHAQRSARRPTGWPTTAKSERTFTPVRSEGVRREGGRSQAWQGSLTACASGERVACRRCCCATPPPDSSITHTPSRPALATLLVHSRKQTTGTAQNTKAAGGTS